MFSDLYYFLSSLPLLRWGEKPPMTYADFLFKCREALGEGKSDWLTQVSLTLDEAPKTALAAHWQERDFALSAGWALASPEAERWLRPTSLLSSANGNGSKTP